MFDVYKGHVHTLPRSRQGHGVTGGRVVAVKTLKLSAGERDLMNEAGLLSQLNHRNIIYMVGVVTRSQPIMVVTEFMHNSSLDQFLQASIQ